METTNINWETIICFAPLFFIALVGYYFKNNPPKKINGLTGYRTKRSMKSQEAWNFAQVYSSGLLLTWSIAGMVGLVLQLLLSNKKDISITSTLILILIVGGVIYLTEKELKEKF